MKKLLFVLLFLSTIVAGFSQILRPVEFTMDQKQLDASTYQLIFKAKIDEGWYVYSQTLPDDGPFPTIFNFDKNGSASLVGKTSETGVKTKEGLDPMWDLVIKKFAKGATFTQKVSITEDTKLTGYFEFMTCDDEQCLPPEAIDFSFDLKHGITEVPEETTPIKEDVKEVIKEEIKTVPPAKSSTTNEITGKVESQVKEIIETEVEGTSNENLTTEEATELEEEVSEPESNQPLRPVSWGVTATESGDKVKLDFKALIDKGWYVYAQEVDEDGPIPTTFTFEENEHVTVEGVAEEVSEHVKQGYDEFFEMDVKKFSDEVDFIYNISPSKREGTLKGYLEFMTCEDGRCLPPEFVDFEVDLATLETKIGEELVETEAVTEEADWGIIPNVDMDNPVSDCGALAVEDEGAGEQSLWVIFLLGLGGGLLALLTPCVFPMIPLTVSFFTKGSENRKKGLFNAFLYGFFIFMVYVLISVPFHLLDSLNPNILNEISTNIWLNIAFFLIFVFFAFSFFGYYEITLPSSLANKSSSAEGAGGVLGIFFMALTLAIVSFSCTGPILGSLLALSSESGGGANQLTAGMAGFGVALALPFALFAAFPGIMNSLPKSGGWLNTVKVVLGFIELALAFKFLSNADLVKHWGLLKYEVFIGIWIIIFILMFIYLIGKLKFPHDSIIKKLSFGRISFAVLTLAFVVYMFSAFRYNDNTKTFSSLGLLSGLAPPAGYSWIYPNDCPQNFSCFHDFYEAQAYAEKVGKPLMIDFTGHACVNCRKVEETVWPKSKNPEIHRLIDEEYVLVSLYVDERIELPEEERITTEYNGKTKTMRTTGDKWAFMEYANFKRVSQPYYVLIHPDGTLLNNPIGYSSASDYIPSYQQFLECGLDAYKQHSGE